MSFPLATVRLFVSFLLFNGVFVAEARADEQPYEVAWIGQFGTSACDQAQSVAVDGSGDAFVAGVTCGSLGGPFAGGPDDAFIAKYSGSGALLWTRQLGTSSRDYAFAVVVNASGQAFIAGITSGRLDGPHAGNWDGFIAKYSASGDVLWIRQFGTSSDDYVYSVAVDNSGNAFIAGYTSGSLGGPSAGETDAFIAKYSGSGALLWTRQLGTCSVDYAFSVALDDLGSAVIAGATSGNLGEPAGAAGSDAFIAKYSASGALLWTRQFGTGFSDAAYAVDVDDSGHALIAGYTSGSLGGPFAGGFYDAFITKYSASGAMLWTRQLGTGGEDFANSIVVNDSGEAFISGDTTGSLGGPLAGVHDAFVAKYSAAGVLLWTRQLGTSFEERSFSIAMDGSGDAFIAGVTTGSLGGPGAGSGDAFIAKFGALLDMVDPNPISSPALIVNGSITQDANVLATGGIGRQGLAADGVTRVILRRETAGPGSVAFSIEDESGGNADIGTLSTPGIFGPGGSRQATTLPTNAVQLDDGRWMAFAVLRAPEDFARGPQDHDLASRPIMITAEFTPSGGGDASPSTASRTISLRRPPVVLLHGLWSDGGTWDWPLQTDSRFSVTTASYDNDEHFADNIQNIRSWIHQAVQSMRTQHNMAATQADVVGHSMGGLLSRLYAAGYTDAGIYNLSTYLRNDNFNAGDINKLITLDTPHAGSPLADALFLLPPTLQLPFYVTGHCIHCGAVADLRRHSAVLTGLHAAAAPAHALVGVGGFDYIVSKVQSVPLFSLLDILNLFTFSFPPGVEHDLIVGRLSQQGGLTEGQASVFGYNPPYNAIHFGPGPITGVTEEAPQNNRVIELLNTHVDDGGAFASSFPAAEGGAAGIASPPPIGDVPIGLTIVSPQPGTLLAAGQAFQVVVEPLKGFEPARVMVVSLGNAVIDDLPPFIATLTVPADVLGPLSVSALGISAAGQYFTAGEVALTAQTDAKLVEVSMSPPSVYLNHLNTSFQMNVAGLYDDGVSHDLTSPSLGTTFASDDEAIATMDADGVVHAVGAGSTTLFAANGDFTTSAFVHVAGSLVPSVAGDLNADGLVNGVDLGILLVQWGGNGSADLNDNGVVNGIDLGILLASWTP